MKFDQELLLSPTYAREAVLEAAKSNATLSNLIALARVRDLSNEHAMSVAVCLLTKRIHDLEEDERKRLTLTTPWIGPNGPVRKDISGVRRALERIRKIFDEEDDDNQAMMQIQHILKDIPE